MGQPDAGAAFPHIPDDWSRVVPKGASNTDTRQAQTPPNTSGADDSAMPPVATSSAGSVRKRKRPSKAASAAKVASANTAATGAAGKAPCLGLSEARLRVPEARAGAGGAAGDRPGAAARGAGTEAEGAAGGSSTAAAAAAEAAAAEAAASPSTALPQPGQAAPPAAKCRGDETESVIRGLFHQVEKLARRPGCALEDGIHLDSIMTHIPYIEVMEQMFGGTGVVDSACVPVVTRAYEESYMREVIGGVDEACIMGSNCECQFVDEYNPFVGVQFALPVEALTGSAMSAGLAEELSTNKMCVLCCRKNTQALFYEALYNHRAYSGCIQLYGNICGRPGEYAREAMLICPLSGPVNNMPLPVVAHQRNRYSVVIHNGVRQLRQHRVGYEDFQAPSSSRC